MTKIVLNFRSQGTKKIELFSQGTDGSPNLRFETLVIADHEYKKVFIIALSKIKLWLKEGDGFQFIFIHIHSSDEGKVMQNAVFFCP